MRHQIHRCRSSAAVMVHLQRGSNELVRSDDVDRQRTLENIVLSRQYKPCINETKKKQDERESTQMNGRQRTREWGPGMPLEGSSGLSAALVMGFGELLEPEVGSIFAYTEFNHISQGRPGPAAPVSQRLIVALNGVRAIQLDRKPSMGHSQAGIQCMGTFGHLIRRVHTPGVVD